MRAACLSAAALALFLCSPLHAQDPSFYHRRATWQETVQSSIERLRSAPPEAPGITLGPWLAVGPFPLATRDGFAETFPPEREFSPTSIYGDGTLRWLPKPEWVDGTTVMFPPTDNSVMYLTRTVSARTQSVLALSLGSDDGIKVWCDSVLVFQHDTYRGAQPDQDTVDLELAPGEHRLLLKINNGSGPTGFYFAVVDAALRTLWRLAARDFPGPRSREEMAWEREDSIWALPWHRGDADALAQRYVAATRFDSPAERRAAVQRAARPGSQASLAKARARYLASRRADLTPVILTPKPSPLPRLNGPSILGVRPGHPFLAAVRATGVKPIRFTVRDLPLGLSLDSSTGRITGIIRQEGTYAMTVTARNSRGVARRAMTIVAGKTIALTPPLGWNSWNCFAEDVDDAKVRAAADAMVQSGLADHGWTYINIDDCWEVKPESTDPMLSGQARGIEGRIMTNRKFPDMAALAEFVHARGLKLGIYSSPGPRTCAGFTASYGHEIQDAAQYAEWGIDYLKYDWCSYGTIEKERTVPALQKPYRTMRQALDGVERDIVYSLCQYGMGKVWEWGAEVGGNCWRTTGDIEDTWESMSTIGFSQAGHEAYARPGNWNDPDMLVVGRVGWGKNLHPTRLTPNEQYTHITLWSLLCSPLLIGCDMTRLDPFTLSLLTNDEVLDVNQDPLGKQAARISVNGDCEVWAKPMSDGSFAVGLFNRGPWAEKVSVQFASLGITGPASVRDLWRQKDAGTLSGAYAQTVRRHGAALLRITGAKKR